MSERLTFSLRTKMTLLCLGSLALLSFLVTAVGAYYFNQQKDMIVDRALTYGEDAASRVEKHIEQELDDDKKLIEISNSRMETMLRIFTYNKRIAWVGIVDKEGKVLYEISQQDIEEGETPTLKPPEQEGYLEKIHQLEGDGEQYDLRYVVSNKVTTEEIREQGEAITRQVKSVVIVLFLLMAGMFVLLYKTFQHHVNVLEENERLDRMAYVGTLASGIAHEIRNPLNAMNINLDLILEDDEVSLDSERGKILGALKSEVGQLDKTLNNFLTFAVRKSNIEGRVDLCALLRDLIEFLTPQLDANNIELTFSLPQEELEIQGDAHSLHRALLNILINAMQSFSDESQNRCINVILEYLEGEAVLRISDNGIGIPEENLEHIFDVFYSTKREGSGFGLSIAGKTIKEHCGLIRVESKVEEGTSVIIIFPEITVQGSVNEQ